MTITPTQADRDAAADLLDELSSLLDHVGIGQVADLIRDGEYDEHEATQAIAAHALAAWKESMESAAQLATSFLVGNHSKWRPLVQPDDPPDRRLHPREEGGPGRWITQP